jgi:hypothetical protein
MMSFQHIVALGANRISCWKDTRVGAGIGLYAVNIAGIAH